MAIKTGHLKLKSSRLFLPLFGSPFRGTRGVYCLTSCTTGKEIRLATGMPKKTIYIGFPERFRLGL